MKTTIGDVEITPEMKREMKLVFFREARGELLEKAKVFQETVLKRTVGNIGPEGVLGHVQVIGEECHELNCAIVNLVERAALGLSTDQEHYAAVLKECCDVVYAILGLCHGLNLPFGIAFDLVHQDNMLKVGADGKPQKPLGSAPLDLGNLMRDWQDLEAIE